MNKSISFSGSLLRITELPKRSMNLDQVSKILSSTDLKELVSIMRELKEENDKLESIINENKQAIEIIMDKVLDDDNEEQREELSIDDGFLINKHIANY
jgi:K+/H+ antiporter YhaU regulatory subunit KhtT